MSNKREPIYVTKTFLPPLDKYKKYLNKIWEGPLTNQGPFLKRLEKELEEYLGVENLHFLTNGTIALQVALRSLDLTEGEIITTPFSYVATTSSILWERCKPVFVDIDPKSFCIDPEKIESAITPMTKAIMPVHVFGVTCDIDRISEIAKKHNLRVIYDAAHAFGVDYKGRSVLSYGDISMCSFHSTKLFHTIEGGCLVVNSLKLSKQVELIKRFGHDADNHLMLGTNAKASEFQAAMGLCNLPEVNKIIDKRKSASEQYEKLLGDHLQFQEKSKDASYNYSYFPVLFKNERQLVRVKAALEKESIFARRYFYPSLNTLPYLKVTRKCEISEDISQRILCLPLSADLTKEDVSFISKIIINTLDNENKT